MNTNFNTPRWIVGKRFYQFLAYGLLSLLLSASACPTGPDPGDPGTTTRTLTMMSANLRQTYNYPNPDSVGWKVRYGQIGLWMAANQILPDFIGLQEVSGWWWCPTNHSALSDYESIAFLLQNIEANTGVRYRIAYFLVDFHFGESSSGIVEGSSTAGGCQTMAGNVLLYNPETVTHLDESGPYLPHDSTEVQIALRRSLPCCNVRPEDAWICGAVDGATDDEKCVSNPTGLAWSVSTAGSDGTMARFRRRGGTRVFNVYNAHWAVGDGNAASRSNADALVTQMEAQYGSSDRWVPPFFMGDLNLLPGVKPSDVWPDRFAVMSPDDGIDVIYQGNYLTLPSYVSARLQSNGSACEKDGISFSDHCFPVSVRPTAS